MTLKKSVLVTGCAGFIGYHLALKLLKKNYEVIGIDNINNYYSKKLKQDRIKDLKNYAKSNKKSFAFHKFDLSNQSRLDQICKKYKFKEVIHLAAQAGVRYSLIYPERYLKSNILSFFNILESCRKFRIKKLIFASSSSVYGNLNKKKFSEKDSTDSPIQFYAATKKSNEVMAHSYSALHGIHCIGLRFFTVYGPWGRPDMSIFKFTKNILANKPIDIFNKGDHDRDFTYISDVSFAVLKLLKVKSKKNNRIFQIFNIGNSRPQKLVKLIKLLENILNKKAKKNFLGLQKGDVKKTSSNISLLQKKINFRPKTKLKYGLIQFVKWYKNYYKVKI